MKHSHIFFIILTFVLVPVLQASASNNFAYGWHPQLSYYITPDSPEIHAGETATFTITVKNRSDKPYKLEYGSGQQWDLAVFHDKTQIFRWSQGIAWEERTYSVSLKSGETKTGKLSWRSVDRLGVPLPQGVYSARGMVVLKRGTLVTEDCSVRLLPPKVSPKELLKVKINMLFEIELPRYETEFSRYADKRELTWNIKYKYNDNRIDIHGLEKTAETVKITFHPKRYGHVEFDFYGYPERMNEAESVERRSYRVEISDDPE